MKKILALILALAMVFAFAACKGKDNDTDTTTEPAGAVDGTTDAAPVDGSEGSSDATDVSGDASTEAQTTPDGSVVEPSNAGTQQGGTQQGGTQQGGTQQGGSTAPAKGLNSTDPATVAAFYCNARKATKPAPKGQQTLKLSGEITADGGLGGALKLVQPVINSALDKNSTETDWIPAGSHADIKVSDVKSASAKVNGNYTVVTMTFKEQTDGSNGDSKNGGPVARGIGTLGSIDGALADLNAEFKSGKENVKLTYTDAKLTCKIDNNTGKIVSGTWHYLVKINISSAELKFKVLPGAINVKNLKGAVDYTVVI